MVGIKRSQDIGKTKRSTCNGMVSVMMGDAI